MSKEADIKELTALNKKISDRKDQLELLRLSGCMKQNKMADKDKKSLADLHTKYDETKTEAIQRDGSVLLEMINLLEAESTVDMFWNVLTAMLEMADTSADKILVNTILDHASFRNLMTRSKMGLRSKLRGDARSKLIVLLRTINNAHDKLKKEGDVYVDDAKEISLSKKGVKPSKVDSKVEPKNVKEAKDEEHKHKVRRSDDDANKAMTPEELPHLIKQMIEFADPDANKKMAKAALIIGPMKTLLTRARSVSMRVPSLIRKRIEDFQASLQ